MSDETTTTDQAEVTEPETGDVDWKSKAREWEKRAKENMTRLKAAEPQLAEYNRLVEASKSDLERAQEAAKQHEQRAIAAERAAMVNEIALTKGLSPALARRLQGDSRESLEADADELMQQFAQATADATQPRAPRADPSQGSSGNGSTQADPASVFADFIKRARA